MMTKFSIQENRRERCHENTAKLNNRQQNLVTKCRKKEKLHRIKEEIKNSDGFSIFENQIRISVKIFQSTKA